MFYATHMYVFLGCENGWAVVTIFKKKTIHHNISISVTGLEMISDLHCRGEIFKYISDIDITTAHH